MPWRASYTEGRRFIEQKRTWIRKQRAVQAARKAQVPKRKFVTGSALPCFGSHVVLEVQQGQRLRTVLRDNKLIITAQNTGQVQLCIERWYRKQARSFFMRQTHVFARTITSHPIAVRITGARTLWGSCSPQRGSVSFTWRLALAPVEVAQYVAAHEAAHLRHARHSAAFWKLVKQLHPNYEANRRFLRVHGHTLEL